MQNRLNSKSANIAAAGILQACAVAGPMGAPGGHLYAGLMGAGYSLSEYEQIMAVLVKAGLCAKRGECYTLTAAGRAMNDKISAAIDAHRQRAAA